MHSDKIEVRMVRVCAIVWKKEASGTISYLQKIQNQASGAACYGCYIYTSVIAEFANFLCIIKIS